jgi:glycosyltransferase 2 family protein
MRGRLRGFAILLLLALACYGLLLFVSDPAQVAQALSSVPAWAAGAALAAALGNYLLRWWRWRWYLRALGHDLPAGFDALSYIGGFAFTATPGKAGEAARAIWLKSRGVAYSDTVGTCVAERLLDLGSVIVIATLVVWPQRDHQWALAAALAVLVLAVVGVALGRWVGALAIRALQSAGPRLARLLAGGERMLRVALGTVVGRRLAAGALLGTAGWLLEATGFWVLVLAFGVDLPWAAVAGVYALGLLAGALSFLPGGLIGTELTVVALLVHLGVPYETAIAVTLAGRACTLWFSIALGLVALGLLQMRGDVVGAAAAVRGSGDAPAAGDGGIAARHSR